MSLEEARRLGHSSRVHTTVDTAGIYLNLTSPRPAKTVPFAILLYLTLGADPGGLLGLQPPFGKWENTACIT